MAHKVSIRNGMTSSDEAALSNVPVAFISTGGGVVATGDYAVTAQGTPDNTVKISTGRAYVPNTAATMMYSTYLDATQNVTITSNVSGNPRIDAIVLYIDMSASPDATASNVAKFYDVTGTPAGSPTAPSNAQILAAIGAGNYYITLANVNVANGFLSINNGNITDRRTYATFVTGQYMSIPLYEEFTDQAAAPSSPAAGKTRLYTLGQALYLKNTAGGVTQIGNNTIKANGNSGSTPSVDWSSGITQSFTLNQASITWAFSNPVIGEKLTLILTQDSGGSKGTSLTWPVSVKWSNNVAPILTTTLSKTDLVGFIYDGTSYYGFVGNNY